MGVVESLAARRAPASPAPALSEDAALASALAAGRALLLERRRPDGSWDFAAHLGAHFLSQYWLCLRWLDVAEPRFDAGELTRRLLATQRPDGSWRQLEEDIDSAGELNATIFNYWFLKASSAGVPTIAVADAMDRARDFARAAGGVEASSLFTKTFLALFGEHPWSGLLRAPFAIFVDGLPFNYRRFSQWVIPHLMPIAYLRANRVRRRMGDAFSARELWLKPPSEPARDPEGDGHEGHAPDPFFDRFLIEKILDWQQPKGSWGGYTVSTILCAMALKHCARASFAPRARLDAAAARGLEFVAHLYVGGGPGSYLGCLMDGHYWDTLLAANAALEASPPGAQSRNQRANPSADLEPSAAYLRASQQMNGGFPYGFDFEYAPDVDDTAEAILLLARLDGPGDRERVARAAAWLRGMQNGDGGWGAFDRDNVGDPLLRRFTRPFEDSVDLFDDSSADSSGHVLDALAEAGFDLRNCAESRQGVAYLRRTQDAEFGAWEGRWGVNWIFGTACALVGLARAGVAPDDRAVARGFEFLLARQNQDGGFGETSASYRDRAQAGRGPSSPSQTAWVLWALCACGRADTQEAARAARWLIASYDAREGWRDPFATGTGHPGLLYMHYPSYAAAFPLLALGAYRRAKRAGN